MRFLESDDRNNFEYQGISIRICGGDYRILSIPEKKINSNNFLELKIDITNSRLPAFRFEEFGNLYPQILTSNGKILRIEEPKKKRILNNYKDYLVQHGEYSFASLYAKICWHNNKLQLRIYSIPIENDNFWIVDNINLGTYQIRFIYRTNIRIAAGIETVRLDTQFITLRLIESVKNNKSVVQVDDIRFQTLVTQPLLAIPKKQHEATTLVQFGLRVTNLSSSSYRFNFHGLKPEIQNINGQLLQRIYNTNATIGTDESHFLLATPEESLTCFIDAELRWYLDSNQLVMQGRDSIGGYWSFRYLNSGSYRVRFTYKGLSQHDVAKLLPGVVLENLWTGTVATPFVEFKLVDK